MEYSISSILSLISHVHSKTAFFLEKRLSAEGLVSLASSHGFILFCLSQNPMLMGELSQKINRDKSTTTALVKKLERLGFVQVEKSNEDSRKKVISLTEKGCQYNKITSEISHEVFQTAFGGFSDEDKESLLSLLTRLSKNLD